MTDSSDESATEGVGLVQNDASDSENSVDSEVEDQGTGFLDVEASESGDSDSESSDDSSDEESDYDDILGAGSSRKAQPKAVFTQFKKLPIELRHRIWQYFCPDLDRSPRVLSFQMVCSPTQDVIWESATLDNQIRAVDAMLGLHQESREIVLKAFPDTLAIREGRRIVHFNKERDIVHINGHRKEWAHNAVIPGFSENVLHLAADIDYFQLKEMQTLASFPEVINFYKFEWHNEGRPPKKLRWCASDKIHRYELQQLQRECRIGEDLHFVYCWPDVEKHPEFAAKHASEQFAAMDGLDELGDELRETILEGDPDLEAETVGEWDVMFEQLCDIKYWRMTCFGWDAADRFPAFLAKHGDAREYDPNEDEEGDDVGESSEEDDSDQNEYESDGIDDATIDEESVNDDEDPDVDDLEIDGSQESEDEEDGGASDFGGFSPLRDEDGGSMLVDGDASAAQFSSPEPEAAGDRPRGRGGRPLVVLDDDDEEEETEAQDSQPPARRRQREFIKIDSEIDDEDDEEEQPAQSTARRRRVVVSDDEDEDEEDEGEKPARPAGRRARVLPSDDEEDEDEGGAEVGDTKAKDESDEEEEPSRAKKPLSLAEKLQRNRRQNPISDESEEEESSEEDAPPKKMSLAEKLMAHRRKNPIESESEPETEGTIGVDDTDDEEDEEEDEDEESGMFMNMAEEGKSGDEQDEDDY